MNRMIAAAASVALSSMCFASSALAQDNNDTTTTQTPSTTQSPSTTTTTTTNTQTPPATTNNTTVVNPPPDTTAAPPPPATTVVVPNYSPEPMYGARSDTITTEHTRPNVGLITSGLIMFGGTYAASTIVAAESSRPADNRLAVPLVGPWLDYGDRGSCSFASGGNTCSNTETANRVLLVADGIAQGLGVLQIVGGFIFPEHKVVQTTVSTASVDFRPSFGSMNGVTASGKF